MVRLSAAQIYAAARAGGFDAQSAVTATAVALAESGGDVAAWGDRTLGNSYGLWQIHWPSHQNKIIDGAPLDQQRLQSDPIYAAKVAYQVSGGGQNWNPWTTFWGPNRSNPAYRQFLGAAQQAAQQVDQGGQDFTGGGLSDVLATLPYGSQGAVTPTGGGGGGSFALQGFGAGGGGTSYQGGGTQGSTAANTGEVPGFGWMEALRQIPEIGELLDRAALENWSPDKLEAEVTNTQWWMKTAPTIRNWIALTASDPAGAQQQIDQTSGNIKRMAAALGLNVSDAQSATIAEQALKLGWGEQEVRNAIIGEAKIPAGATPEGTIGLSAQQVKALAKSYMTPVSDQQALDFSLRLAKGEITEEGLQVHFANNAKARFAWLAPSIDAGFTPAETFDAHRQAIAQTLELDPESIDMAGDQRWWPVLEVPGEQRSMTVAEAGRWARNQSDYESTDIARQQAYEFGNFLTTSFGLRR